MDRFDAMRTFVQVVDSRRYTQAALRLNLHKSTISQHVQQLVEQLDIRLLTRTTRAVAPTEEGLLYYAHAMAILQQMDEAEARLRKGTSSPAGHLRVDVPPAMGRMVFAPEIRGFLERYPKITLELGCTDRSVDLVQVGIDCALRGRRLPDSGLSARPVGALRFVLCAAPHCIERYGLPLTPDQLRHFQVGCVLASTGKLRPVMLLREDQTVEVDVPARLVTTDSAATLSAALDGAGLVVLSEFIASHYLASGSLVRVLPGWRCPSLPLQLVTPAVRKRAARVQVFMGWAHALLLRRLGSQLKLV